LGNDICTSPSLFFTKKSVSNHIPWFLSCQIQRKLKETLDNVKMLEGLVPAPNEKKEQGQTLETFRFQKYN